MATPTPHTCTHTHWRVLKRKRPVPCEFAYSKRVCYSRHAGADETAVVSFYIHITHTQHIQQPTHILHNMHRVYTSPHIHTPCHLGHKSNKHGIRILVVQRGWKNKNGAGIHKLNTLRGPAYPSHTVTSLASLCRWAHSIAQAWYTGCTQTCFIS